MASILSGARGLLGKVFAKNSVAEQILVWQVAGQVIGALMAPMLTELTKLVNSQAQTTPLSAAQLADMVVRAIVSASEGADLAKLVGVAPSDFRRLVDAAGDGPSPGDLVVALRRGLIAQHGAGADSTSFEQGIRESHLHNKWTDIVRQLGTALPSPTDALEALLEGQVDDATARSLYEKFGGDPEHFTMLFNTRGSAPTPLEASEMANRGIIPWDGTGAGVTSQHQAFLEGPYRDKWLEPYRKLAEYKPPARTITAMVRSGALSDEKALKLFRELGLAQDMAQAMLDDAHHQKLAASKDLAKGDVETLYRDQVISAADATTMFGALGYSAQESAWLLAMQDLKRSVAAINAATSRVHTLYVNRKIDKAGAVGALNSLHVPAAQVDQLLSTWDIERFTNVKVLSQGEIASAFFYKILGQDEAMAELVAIGFTPLDAWIILSVRTHNPLPNKPPAGPGG